jgi:hypothetical protein
MAPQKVVSADDFTVMSRCHTSIKPRLCAALCNPHPLISQSKSTFELVLQTSHDFPQLLYDTSTHT